MKIYFSIFDSFNKVFELTGIFKACIKVDFRQLNLVRNSSG